MKKESGSERERNRNSNHPFLSGTITRSDGRGSEKERTGVIFPFPEKCYDLDSGFWVLKTQACTKYNIAYVIVVCSLSFCV